MGWASGRGKKDLCSHWQKIIWQLSVRSLPVGWKDVLKMLRQRKVSLIFHFLQFLGLTWLDWFGYKRSLILVRLTWMKFVLQCRNLKFEKKILVWKGDFFHSSVSVYYGNKGNQLRSFLRKPQNWSVVGNACIKKVNRKFMAILFASEHFLLHQITNNVKLSMCLCKPNIPDQYLGLQWCSPMLHRKQVSFSRLELLLNRKAEELPLECLLSPLIWVNDPLVSPATRINKRSIQQLRNVHSKYNQLLMLRAQEKLKRLSFERFKATNDSFGDFY